MNPERPTPRHIVIKAAKGKDKESLESSKRKTIHIQGKPHKFISADFSAVTLQAIRECEKMVKLLKEENLQPGNTVPSKVIVHNWRRDFSRQAKVKDFIT